MSEHRYNKNGVPQGSVLGPLLFLLYINDIIEITHHPLILFADDISIIMSSDKNADIKDFENEINNTIKQIISYLTNNNLTINLSKTNYIQFRTKNKIIPQLNINYDNKIITKLEQTKFLGITIDQDINWKGHIEAVCNKINRFVYVLAKLRQTATLDTALAAYYGYVASILRYGLLLWGNSCHIKKVFLMQKKCIRAICGAAPLDSCRPLFKNLGVLTLPCIYILECACFVKLHPEFFKRAVDVYLRNTRNPSRIVLNKKPRTQLYQKNCETMCGKIYNKIPNGIKDVPFKLFTRKLKHMLKEKSYYSIKEFLDDT